MSVFAGRLSQVVKLSPPLQPLYEGWFLALFNLLYSTLPVLYIGLFEQVSAHRVSCSVFAQQATCCFQSSVSWD